MEPVSSLSIEGDDASEEQALVHVWRAEQLRRLGLPPTLAFAFAGLIDWHEVSDLVERGCAPELALEIVR
jgi:hypothetical protein